MWLFTDNELGALTRCKLIDDEEEVDEADVETDELVEAERTTAPGTASSLMIIRAAVSAVVLGAGRDDDDDKLALVTMAVPDC